MIVEGHFDAALASLSAQRAVELSVLYQRLADLSSTLDAIAPILSSVE